MEGITTDTAETVNTAQGCDTIVQELLEVDARLAQHEEDDDNKYPEHRSVLINMVKDSMRKRNRAMVDQLTTTKQLAERNYEHIALQNAHKLTLGKYVGLLREEVGIGLGCFVGGLLLGITLNIEPKWLFGRR